LAKERGLSKIKSARASEAFDSRGNPTVRVTLSLDDGVAASAMVPSGASTGAREAHELRDGDAKRFNGKGVLKAVANVNSEIARAIVGLDVFEQRALDEKLADLDGTPNKKRLGANALLGVSLAAVKAAARCAGQPLYRRFGELTDWSPTPELPLPLMNILNGGAHAANSTDFQEFMIAPVGVDDFGEALRVCAEVYAALKRTLTARGLTTNIGDEGGFAPNGVGNRAALELVGEAVVQAGYAPGKDVLLALDVAASEFYDSERRVYKLASDQRELTAAELSDFYAELINDFPLFSIEDPFAEDDWSGWNEFMRRLPRKTQVVGDDLFVTQREYLQRGVDERSANAILIKLNQVGTVSETLDTMALARRNGFGLIVSHRSGETEDAYIADLAVGSGAGQIKAGALARGERTAKYNRLLQIAADLGAAATYAGGNIDKWT